MKERENIRREMPDSDREQQNDLKPRDQVDEGSGPSGSGQGNGRQNLFKYGELVILGYNGQLPQGDPSFETHPSLSFSYAYFSNGSWLSIITLGRVM